MAHSFYRPHKRVTFDNTWIDPTTGEIAPCPSMTKQEFQNECDINNIIKSFSSTGMLKHVSARAQEGMYTDLPDDTSFQSAVETVERANQAFMSLPSKIREKFSNDPQAFLAFTADPSNLEEMRKLGLAVPQPQAVVSEATATPPPSGEPPKTQ